MVVVCACMDVCLENTAGHATWKQRLTEEIIRGTYFEAFWIMSMADVGPNVNECMIEVGGYLIVGRGLPSTDVTCVPMLEHDVHLSRLRSLAYVRPATTLSGLGGPV